LRQLGQQSPVAQQLQQTISDSEAAILEINAALDAFGEQTSLQTEVPEPQSNKTI
jgi:hypothetical protein